MKILFFITIFEHGMGGHGYSLSHISNSLSKNYSVKIISIGPGNGQTYVNNPNFLCHLDFNGINFIKTVRLLKKKVKNYNPDYLHCFDVSSYNIIRVVFNSKKRNIILNKCGGPNIDNYPYVKNLVLFSKENYIFYKRSNKFTSSNLFYIPNRVIAIKKKPNFSPIVKDNNLFNFVRINRINDYYKKSIYDSINLIEVLYLKAKLKVKLYLIGVIENNELFEEIKKNKFVKNGQIVLLTDIKYVKDASKMLYLADAVIGTGRGFMESTSLKKPMLAFNANGDLPILITNENYMDAFSTNFSNRNVFRSHDDNQNLNSILKLINDKSYYNELADFSLKLFYKYFNIDKYPNPYLKVYAFSQKGERQLWKDKLQIMRSIYSFYIISKMKKKSFF